MKSILVTGSSGFIGRNVLPYMKKRYNVSAPSRSELDLSDAQAVMNYLEKQQFDAVVHLANPTGHNPVDSHTELFERSLMVFLSLERCIHFCGKIIYIGSGAEYGKHRAISSISEEEFGIELPRDPYGLSRYAMSKLAEKQNNIVNLRLFACCGSGDPSHKLIPHIVKCINSEGIVRLNQDVWFDFIFVNDIPPVLVHFIENTALHKAYNLCSGSRILISSIAETIRKQMCSSIEIVFQKDGLNFEYTGSNERLRSEITDWNPRPMSEAIKEILLQDEFEDGKKIY